MPGGSDRKSGAETLRLAVERRLAERPPPESGEAADAPRLLQELRVHQLELEIQNEALREARLAAEHALARSLQLYEQAPVAYVTLGGDGSILQVNQAALRLFELTPSDLPAGQVRLEALVAEPSLPDLARLLDRILAGQAAPEVEASLRARDGGAGGTVILQGMPDPQGSGGLVALIDITERRQAQEELKRAKIGAEWASAAKTRFLSATSHDLRQPLQTLYLIGGMLARQPLAERGRDLIVGLEQALAAMTGMLDILLDLNEIESGRVKPKWRVFELEPLFDQLEQEFAYHARTKGIRLRRVGCRRRVRTDRDLLCQMLRNLLSNAIKYTPRGKILLGVRRRGNGLRIEVCDTGIGMAEDQLAVIFEEFRQLDNPGRQRARGLGLGLAIVRRQAELLGHPIGVRSRPGRGSLFWIDLPQAGPGAEPDAILPPPVERQPVSLRRRTVLVVEDDPAISLPLERLLVAEGASVMSALEGRTALEHVVAATVPPDLLIIDYTLPNGMTGLELLDTARRVLTRAVPAILLSGDASSRLATAIAEREGCVLLIKPVTAGALLRAIPSLPPLPAPSPLPDASVRDPTVFVIDDDSSVRAAMVGLFAERGWAVEGYADAETFLEAVIPGRQGCLLIDAVMPGIGGIELLRRLQVRGDHLPAIVMTGHGDVAMAVAAMKAGASDFVAKPVQPSDLLALVAHALKPDDRP